MVVRTRFAPSPTGDLHIGGARTALFAWAFAKANGGEFILRIEDTDRERHNAAAVDKIIQAMQWLGMDYDEGPFYQSERGDKYRAAIDKLLAEGKAYRCTCSKERLDNLREEQMRAGGKPKYDGCCRDKNLGPDCGDHVVRFRTPTEGVVEFDDMVRGHISVANAELDDLIIARTDGNPTYNLTVVVDDMDMQISHVIRGDDHINNTPRQIHIFRALDAAVPVFAHVPSILGVDGKKLSKRTGAASVMEYQAEGFLSAAVLNYLIRLGWSHGDEEIFSREQIIKLFDMEHVQKSPSALNPDKLLWLNQHYMKTTSAAQLVQLLLPFYKLELGVADVDADYLQQVIEVFVERCKTLVEFVEQTAFLFLDHVVFDDKAVAKFLKPEIKPVLAEFAQGLKDLPVFAKDSIAALIKTILVKFELKMGKFAPCVRVAVTGTSVSPSLDVTLALLGKEKSISRLEQVIKGDNG